MSSDTGTGTGFCRVTVAAPDRRIDVALPEDLPLADVYPELLRLSGQTLAEGAPPGFHLVRRDGTVLDSGLPLAAQQIRDGDLLSLRPFAESLPGPVYDDVAEAVAAAVGADRSQWNPQLLRGYGLVGSALLLVLLAFALWVGSPAHDPHSLPGLLSGVTAVLLTALAGARARVYRDRGSALALGLAALPHAFVGGSGLPAPAAGEGRIQFLAGCVAVLVVAVLLTTLLPVGDAPFVAAVLVAAAGTAAACAGIIGGASARGAAAVTAVAAVALIGFLPQLSARLARLPVAHPGPRPAPQPADHARIADRARRGHELLGGLVGGCAAVLSATGSRWPELLALALGLAVTLRARLFRRTPQVLCLLAAGILALVLTAAGASLHLAQHPRSDLPAVALAAAVALGAVVLLTVALVVPDHGVAPAWARILDLVDGLALAALLPLALAVLDVYARVRALTG